MSFYNSVKVIVNIFIIAIISLIIGWFIIEQKINRLDKRLGKYAITSSKNHDNSLFDYVIACYKKMQFGLLKLLNKSKVLIDYARHYEKYTTSKEMDPMRFIAAKFLGSFFGMGLVIISDILKNSTISSVNLFMAIIIGFFVPDVFLMGRKFLIKKEMENDLLKAVTIMNNCFKSGRSIMQALRIVSEELEGPLKQEFQKMVDDMDYGLTIEAVFERFESRVKLPEIKYISTSLSILNKTGGNIVKVFSSIEKTFFNNRKLAEELKNLTSASKFLYRILVLIPFIFVLVIYVLDPTYFNPLLGNAIGYGIIVVAMVVYISYILIIKKVISIKE